MSLKEKLEAHKKKSQETAPPEALQVMQRATDDLRQSGILTRVLKVGDRVPEFTLPDEQGQSVNSAALLGKGPLVISFYRGAW